MLPLISKKHCHISVSLTSSRHLCVAPPSSISENYVFSGALQAVGWLLFAICIAGGVGVGIGTFIYRISQMVFKSVISILHSIWIEYQMHIFNKFYN